MQWFIDHPAFVSLVLIPLLGFVYSLVAPPLAARYPALAPVLDYVMRKLPELHDAREKMSEARRPAPSFLDQMAVPREPPPDGAP